VSTGAEARWADGTVQQCLDLCCSVDLVYKLLIQEIQPVLGKRVFAKVSSESFTTTPYSLFRRYRLFLICKICQGFLSKALQGVNILSPSYSKCWKQSDWWVIVFSVCSLCYRRQTCPART